MQTYLFQDDEVLKLADRRRKLRIQARDIQEKLQDVNDKLKGIMADKDLTEGVVKYSDGEKEVFKVKTSISSKKVVDKKE